MRPGFLCLALLVMAAGCSRLDHFGQEPSFSPIPAEHGKKAQSDPYPSLGPPPGWGAASASLSPASHNRTSGSLWSSDPKSLFGDRRAKKVGDILTVLIEIDDEAELSNTTARSRSGDESASVGGLYGLEEIVGSVLPGDGLDAGVSANSSSASSGQGQVRRNEAISLKVAARVVDVLPTGHLVITGRQEVRVNFELRDLQVAGLIRPEDISRNNDITYDKMAEARISYGGRGHISDMQQARYGQQFWDMIAPF